MESKEKFRVEGMTCAACVSHVEKAALKAPHVKSAQVSLLSNSMEVTLEEGADIQEIENSVAKAGYKAIHLSNDESKSAADPNTDEGLDWEGKATTKKLLWRLIPSLIILIPLFYLGMGGMLDWPLGGLSDNLLNLAFVEAVLAGLLIVINLPYFISGFKALIHLSPNMDTLVALGSGVSYVYSLVILGLMNANAVTGAWEHVMHLSMNLSFESAGMVLVFVLLGKTLESRAKGQSTGAIRALLSLAPKTARIERNGEEIEIPAKEIRKGDIVLIRPGESFPVDGTVVFGSGSVDESALTGEALPVAKELGSPVYSGTVNKEGFLKVEAVQIGAETSLQKIVHLVEKASATKPKIAKLADKIAGIFVPVVLGFALLTFLGWLLFGANWLAASQNEADALSYAFERALSVLVISCPCALGLATPVAVMVATGKGAKNGILYKNAEVMEEASKVMYIAFDKTGTLTNGQMEVTGIYPYGHETRASLLGAAKALEEGSEHPLGKAIMAFQSEEDVPSLKATDFEAVPGKGIKALLDGEPSLAGNLAFVSASLTLPKEAVELSQKLQKDGKTALYFVKNGVYLGLIALSDALRDDAKETVRALKEEGYRTVMLTGDNRLTAAAIGKEAGVDLVLSELLPGDKLSIIKTLKEHGRVLMVGDGINDAPALMEADIGLAIGGGADVALESADLIATGTGLKTVLEAVHLSKLATRNIAENLFWAFFYNLVMIPIAAGAYSALGLAGLKPWMGAAAMSLSSVTVVLNALRLNLYDLTKKRWHRKPAELPDELVKPAETRKEVTDSVSSKTIHVEGMMCEMCVKHVKKALEGLGYQKVEVSLSEKTATFQTGTYDEAKTKEAIEEAGYSLRD